MASATLKGLCLAWLHEMSDAEKQMQLTRASHSRAFQTYKRAFDALSKYPLQLATVRDALVVKGIGPHIVAELETRLTAHIRAGGHVHGAEFNLEIAQNELFHKQRQRTGDVSPSASDKNNVDPAQPAPKRSRRVEYVPKYRSGAWAILVSLKHGPTFMNKHEIIKAGQDHADKPLDAPAAGGNTMYTGWSSMKTLKEKELVIAQGNPPQFSLTEEGHCLVDRMLASAANRPQRAVSSESESEAETVLASQTSTRLSHAYSPPFRQPSLEPAMPKPAVMGPRKNVTLWPGEYEIVLILDTREVKNGRQRSFFYDGLQAKGVKVEQRMLDLGDVMWIARPKTEGQYHGDEEIVLEYIIERKTLDDLVSSIKDGRFSEQKVAPSALAFIYSNCFFQTQFRLSRCGVKNVIYVIEEVSIESAELFGMESVYTSLTQTQLENGFFVKKTSSAEDTLSYLVSLTAFMKAIYRNKALTLRTEAGEDCKDEKSNIVRSVTFEDFGKENSKTKNFTLGDVWVRQLMTVQGISLEKAVFFARTFNTSAKFFKALSACKNDTERESLIQKAGGEHRKGLGVALSKKLLNVFWRAEVSTEGFEMLE
ncbi:hypothetical protein BC830DRAFT_1163692 [Chytriomyces sp. MP71]|nr:hypothetical protein BC830DRAFT_1163692 [Chytriomyces sp. MP71]